MSVGVVSNYDDAENWCHIDYHLKHPETIGTVVFADRNSPYFKRTQETVKARWHSSPNPCDWQR